MSKSLSLPKAKEHLRIGRLLMVTLGPTQSYSIDGVGSISPKAARTLIGNNSGDAGQSDLLLESNEDGLFPGMPQTWRAL